MLTPGPHSDLASGTYSTPSRTAPYSFGPNTPFLFHAPPPPPSRPWEPYDPNKWARTDFGFGTTATHVDDIDMDGAGQGAGELGSPAKPKKEEKKSKAATVENVDDPTSPERKIATGAVTRARRRRRNLAQQEVGRVLGALTAGA